jgi:DNA-binding NarL/FixJ family response regulator
VGLPLEGRNGRDLLHRPMTAGESAIIASLTPREREVLNWLAKGLAPRDIAVYMGVSPSTVRTWRQYLADKLGTSNQIQTVRRGYELGLIEGAVSGIGSREP